MSRSGLVILLPGLWMPAFSMGLLARRLRALGYRVTSFSYRSMRDTLDDSAARLAAFAACQPEGPVHFVGHSMGGLVILHALASGRMSRAGRVVLLGSPLAGCYAARVLARLPGGRMLLGRSMPERMDGPAPMPGGAQIGVIAGDRSLGLGRLVARDLPRPNDGVITVDETRAPGLPHIVLDVSHSLMPFSRRIVRAVARFLEDGRFEAGAQEVRT